MFEIQIGGVGAHVSTEHLHGRRPLEMPPESFVHVRFSSERARQLFHHQVTRDPRRYLRGGDPHMCYYGLQPSVQRLHLNVEGRFWYAPPPREECCQLRRHDPIVPTSQAAVEKIGSRSSAAVA